MDYKSNILKQIKASVEETAPNAVLILYGSFARGDFKNESDVDLLILLDKDLITRADEMKVKNPLYDIEIRTGRIISPLIISKRQWQSRHIITPFFKNVTKEGVVL